MLMNHFNPSRRLNFMKLKLATLLTFLPLALSINTALAMEEESPISRRLDLSKNELGFFSAGSCCPTSRRYPPQR